MVLLLEMAVLQAIKALVDTIAARHTTTIVQTLLPSIDAAIDAAVKAIESK